MTPEERRLEIRQEISGRRNDSTDDISRLLKQLERVEFELRAYKNIESYPHKFGYAPESFPWLKCRCDLCGFVPEHHYHSSEASQPIVTEKQQSPCQFELIVALVNNQLADPSEAVLLYRTKSKQETDNLLRATKKEVKKQRAK